MLDNLIKEHISPFLKKKGFKKNRTTWNKQVNNYIHVINVQRSRFNDKNNERFTINLGIFIPVVWQKCWSKDPSKVISEDNCFPRFRIGAELIGPPKDRNESWFVCEAKTDINKLGEQIINSLDNISIPFLDTLLSLKIISNLYEKESEILLPIEKLYLAIIYNELGEMTKSTNLINEVAGFSGWADRANIVRSNLG